MRETRRKPAREFPVLSEKFAALKESIRPFESPDVLLLGGTDSALLGDPVHQGFQFGVAVILDHIPSPVVVYHVGFR